MIRLQREAAIVGARSMDSASTPATASTRKYVDPFIIIQVYIAAGLSYEYRVISRLTSSVLFGGVSEHHRPPWWRGYNLQWFTNKVVVVVVVHNNQFIPRPLWTSDPLV